MNIPENIYEEPDLTYNTIDTPTGFDPPTGVYPPVGFVPSRGTPTGFDPPISPKLRANQPPPIEENIYSTLPGDRESGTSTSPYNRPTSTPYDPYSNDDEPEIAHNPLYGRSSAIFSYD